MKWVKSKDVALYSAHELFRARYPGHVKKLGITEQIDALDGYTHPNPHGPDRGRWVLERFNCPGGTVIAAVDWEGSNIPEQFTGLAVVDFPDD